MDSCDEVSESGEVILSLSDFSYVPAYCIVVSSLITYISLINQKKGYFLSEGGALDLYPIGSAYLSSMCNILVYIYTYRYATTGKN